LAVLGIFVSTRPWSPLAGAVVSMVVWVNVGWGVLNWLPIRPLDGGHLLLAFLEMVAPRRAGKIATGVFIVTGIAATGVALYFDLIFAAALAGFMTWAEFSRLTPARPARPTAPLEFSYDEPEEEPEPGPKADG